MRIFTIFDGFCRTLKTSYIVSQKVNLEIGKTPIFHLFLPVFTYTYALCFLYSSANPEIPGLMRELYRRFEKKQAQI